MKKAVPIKEEPTTKEPYTIRRRGRFWEVLDPQDELVCITVYKRGACEVIRRLAA